MILVGSQRGGGRALAVHLLKEENDHVEVHELRGFACENLRGALHEAHAVSKATKCKQYLFSLSLSPPPGENVETAKFRDAIDRVEKKLGLEQQPRAIVFHEKEGRRHCHVVWSRIDAGEMKAVPLSFTHRKLNEIGRELYLENGWKMPRGFAASKERDPRNFTLDEWQQAKRNGKDPRSVKADIQDSWAVSDSKAAFAAALKARGYVLAKGDRRSFVAVDWRGEAYAIAKWAGVKTKQVRDRLGKEDFLPSIDQAKATQARDMLPALQRMREREERDAHAQQQRLDTQRKALASKQNFERAMLEQSHAKRQSQEQQQRQSRYQKGLLGLWDRVTGGHGRIKRENENDAYASLQRDSAEKDALIFAHLEQRRALARQNAQQQVQLEQRLSTIKSEIKTQTSAAESAPQTRLDTFRKAAEHPPERSAPRSSQDRLSALRADQSSSPAKPDRDHDR